MWARESQEADLKMVLINSDGSVPEMCGNGLRCLVKHAVDHLGLDANPMRVETGAGVLSCRWERGSDGRVARVEVGMGAPSFERAAIPMKGDGDATEVALEVDGTRWLATGVGTGNPHMVIFGEASEAVARQWGPLLTDHPLWPQGTNVEFTTLLSPTHLKVWVWERGCGLTQACGTGATAAAAAAVLKGHCPSDTAIVVSLPGGDLTIRIASDFHQAWMSGPATEVFHGRWAP